MNKIKLLDVTLRDGGYKTNFHYSKNVIENIVKLLDQSGIQYIEVGYRNGPLKLSPDLGQAGLCPRDYLEFCRNHIKSAKLTVILHPHNVDQSDFAELHECGVDAVRICFPIKNPSLGFKTIELAKKYNFEIFTNLTRVSYLTKQEIGNWVVELDKVGADVIYLADSNGSLRPYDIENIFSYLSQKTAKPLGFHAHDNLFLAQANALVAMQNGVQYIDASLLGFGKGAGNLRTEGLVSYLYSVKNHQFDICKLLEAAEYVIKNLQNNQEISAKDIILGVFNLSQDHAQQLGQFTDTFEYYNKAKNFYSEHLNEKQPI